MELTEKQIDSQCIYKGKILDLYRDEVALPNGAAGVREYIRHVGAVCVVPVTEDGKVVLEKQFRSRRYRRESWTEKRNPRKTPPGASCARRPARRRRN